MSLLLWRDRGSITAEFAIALPAVIAVLALCLSGVQVAGQQLRLQDAAAVAARAAARGDGTAVVQRLSPGSAVSQWTEGDLVCVGLTTPAAWGLTLTSHSCALGGGL